jgi:uroporphyrinogen-III decarboxylase
MTKTLSSRDRILAALNCQTPDHPPCSFMIFGALHQRADSYLDFVERQLALGLDAFVMLPPRPPLVQNDHYNLHGLPVSYHPEVQIEEMSETPEGAEEPLLTKVYHTPAGDLTAKVRQTEDWRWGNHVPFLDDYLIPRSKKFIVEGPDDLPAFQYLLVPPTEEEVAEFKTDSAVMIEFAKKHSLLIAGGWGVGADMIGWVHGLNSLVYDVYDRPDFVRDLLGMIAEWNRQRMQVVLDAGIDLYIKRAWYENADFFTPGYWQKLIQPELARDVELAHQAGAKFGYIITASAMPLLELIAETGVDVLIGVDPEAFDLALTKETLGGRVCLWGGVNGHLTVEHGTSEAVTGEVTAALQSLGPDGFILSPVDNVRQDTPLAMNNVNTLIQTWQSLTGQVI